MWPPNGPDVPDVIFPYSVASWIAEEYHDAPCLNAGCSPATGSDATSTYNSVICEPGLGVNPNNPTITTNPYGCDENGPLTLNLVSEAESTNTGAAGPGAAASIKSPRSGNPMAAATVHDYEHPPKPESAQARANQSE